MSAVRSTETILFPPLEPYAQGRLQVDDLHTLYWEECGNPNGLPVVYLHGGPGAGCSPTHRRFFDPDAWRIILFDQRGAGRSTPLAETRQNTTELLIDDIERIRKLRGIERWHVFGGSWGSTLGLAYAETHPERCLGLMLRGIFLFRQKEIDWFLDGIRAVFPEAWRDLAAIIPPDERHDLGAAYARRFTGTDDVVRRRAARVWLAFERRCSTLMPSETALVADDGDPAALAVALLESHYFTKNRPTPDTQLLDNIDRLRAIPGAIVQGRYDMICPIATADELHHAWPEASYEIIPDAGHSALDPSLCAALVALTERFKKL